MMKGQIALNKKAFIVVLILLVILIIAVTGVRIYISNNQPDPPTNEEIDQVDDIEETEPQELTVDFFGEFEPFECKGAYTSFGYEGDVTNREGTLFFSKSSRASGEHDNAIAYVLPNGEEGIVFFLGDTDAYIEVKSVIDDALYFNVYDSKGAELDGFYRMLLKYNEAGEVSNGGITMRFNQSLEPMSVGYNTILLRSGAELYKFDTQTGEYNRITLDEWRNTNSR